MQRHGQAVADPDRSGRLQCPNWRPACWPRPRQLLLGRSFAGGIVALEVQRQAPGRVIGLALLNTSGRGPSEEQQERGGCGGIEPRPANSAGSRRSWGGTLPAGAQVRSWPTPRWRWPAVGPDGFLRQLAAQGTRPDSLGRRAGVEVPVLVLRGELDLTCPPELQQELVEQCPAAELWSRWPAPVTWCRWRSRRRLPRLRRWLAVYRQGSVPGPTLAQYD